MNGGWIISPFSSRKVFIPSGAGYINQAAAPWVYNPRISSLVFAAVLRSRFVSEWEREKERSETAAAEIFDTRAFSLYFWFFEIIFLKFFWPVSREKKSRIPHFVGLFGKVRERQRQRQRGLYVWQSRWCWRAVSRWILLSILRELFLLFSESL